MWIYFIVIPSPATSHLIVLCLCLKFPARWFFVNGKHPWFRYRFIKIDLVPVAKFCFNFSGVLGGVVDNASMSTPARAYLKATKYEIQKPATCRATLFRCKFSSMFSVFHLP